MTLFAFVLLAAFFLENDDFIAASVSDDGCLNSRRADIGARAFAREQRFNLDCLAGFFINRRHAQSLPVFDRELFSARSNNCVTHCFISP